MAGNIEIRHATRDDRDAWEGLFRDYMVFYGCAVSETALDTTWCWIIDPNGPMECLLAVKEGQVVGLAQYRAVPETLTGSWFGHLDDLFVAPKVRRAGVAQALMKKLSEVARDRGWFKLTWITADDNATARRLYDQITNASNWVVYEQMLAE
ncbi:MAG: GNAT family N-acetyltransferase [Thalassospira sp.]|uniref:GNAT family N-acetyltransferase n=1 Tax=Thalassospira sp. TaxID=1912094 RepID=UPI001B1D60A4|nr:GNAT family N-acetyltransferase [Thalassospira sp.]MBO6579302.1 GNAT family N-acetyltransferase [Thalassospira sp.]MBO6819259.1 GNAT family N-acetyltransferase [Thalassospira sp.]MBO6889710.1 GNAT family N-acetyltransferase [Thalassospira sp.]